MSVTDSKMDHNQQRANEETATTNASVPSTGTAVATVIDNANMNGESNSIKGEAETSVESSNDLATIALDNSSIATGTTVTPPIKTVPSTREEVKDDDEEEDTQSIQSEGADEEDALFTNLEQEEEKEEAAHPHEQPNDKKAAPKLLQSALAKGDVKMDDSEHGTVASDTEIKAEDGREEATEEEPHFHHRVRNSFVLLLLFLSFTASKNSYLLLF
jgi:hypothetical protein